LVFPGETKESIQQTFEFARAVNIDSVQLHNAKPFPGTGMFNDLKKQGKLKTVDWDQYNVSLKPVFQLDYVDEGFLEHFRISAYGRWLKHKLSNPFGVAGQVPYL